VGEWLSVENASENVHVVGIQMPNGNECWYRGRRQEGRREEERNGIDSALVRG
jgi:hypothetical protein